MQLEIMKMLIQIVHYEQYLLMLTETYPVKMARTTSREKVFVASQGHIECIETPEC